VTGLSALLVKTTYTHEFHHKRMFAVIHQT